MSKFRNLISAATLVSLAAFGWLVASSASAVELLPRSELFGNPERSTGRISPDGRMLAFLAPRDGVMNVWVAPVGDLGGAKPLTLEAERPVSQYFWAPDSSRVFYLQDQGGNENFLLFSVDLAGARTDAHTPFEKTRAVVLATSPEVQDAILVGLNNRNPQFHDVYRLDLKTGRLGFVYQNDEWAGFDFDRNKFNRVTQAWRQPGSSYNPFI